MTTTKAAHTPGPWTAQKIGKHHFVSGGNAIAIASTYEAGAVLKSFHAPISDDTCEANARLIAAAPELLAALVACSDELEKCWKSDGMVNQNRYVAQAREVIAKAKGE